MAKFILKFGAPLGGDGEEQHALDAQTLDEAKAMAAVLYAGASFKPTPPTSYRIVSAAGTEVYRFPEWR